MPQDVDPGRVIAAMALTANRTRQAELLQNIASYCVEQLSWRASDQELEDAFADLRRDAFGDEAA